MKWGRSPPSHPTPLGVDLICKYRSAQARRHHVAPAEPPSQLRVEVMGTGSVGLPLVEIKSKGRQRSHEFDFEGASRLHELVLRASAQTQRIH